MTTSVTKNDEVIAKQTSAVSCFIYIKICCFFSIDVIPDNWFVWVPAKLHDAEWATEEFGDAAASTSLVCLIVKSVIRKVRSCSFVEYTVKYFNEPRHYLLKDSDILSSPVPTPYEPPRFKDYTLPEGIEIAESDDEDGRSADAENSEGENFADSDANLRTPSAGSKRKASSQDYDDIQYSLVDEVPDFPAIDGFVSNILPGIKMVSDPTLLSPAEMHSKFWPWEYIETTVLPATNKKLKDSGLKKLTFNEIKLFFAYWLAMGFFQCGERHDFWRTQSRFLDPAPGLGQFGLSKHRFDEIIKHLTLHDQGAQITGNNDELYEVYPSVTTPLARLPLRWVDNLFVGSRSNSSVQSSHHKAFSARAPHLRG